jgi:hypothetical protein
MLKRIVKSGYLRLVYLSNKKGPRVQSINEPVTLTISNRGSFFGYYDKSPENSKGWTIACTTLSTTSSVPALNDNVSLHVFGADGEVLLTQEIITYNWQQACRAHWLSDDLVLYNDFDNQKRRYVSRVLSVEKGGLIKNFKYPVQDSFKTDYFISLNYQRLMTLRPDYGYRNLPNLTESELNNLEKDGLWKVNYETGDAELLISLAQASRHEEKPEFKQGVHKFNHVMISPNGQKFVFMHRCLVNGRRLDRLFLANSETGDLKLLADYGMVSHCFWADDDTVLGYMRGPDDKDAYWLLDVVTTGFTQFGAGKLEKYGDGHPHVSGDWFITDTYPDKARMQHLILCNWKTGVVTEIGEFFHGFEFSGESRCDLHPRFSPDGRAVYFDSVFSGKRQLYRMALPC